MANVVVILANPVAKRGEVAVRRVADKLASAFEQKGCEVRKHFTARDGLREAGIVQQHATDADKIVAVGGDGTVRETVLAMNDEQRARTTIAFVPMGNANVLAREVGIPCNDEDKAIETAVTGTARPMDVGMIDGKPTFLLMLDVGYFAYIVHKVAAMRRSSSTRWLYTTLGDVLYTLIGLVKFLIPSAKLTVTADDHEPFTARSLAIANARQYAKTGSFCPAADPGDGILDFNAARPARTIGYAFAGVAGRPLQILSRTGRAKTFHLKATSRGFLCQVDGDPLGTAPVQELTIEVHPNHYQLTVPSQVHS